MYKQEQMFSTQVKNKQILLLIGKKGKEYKCMFNLDSIGIPDVESFELGNFPEGISYSKEEEIISGIPDQAGDYKITLSCVSKHGFIEEKELMLIILPDPKDLWKNIPTPTDIEYYKPDCECKFLKVETKNALKQKNLIAASQRGRSHAHEGNPRDDDFALHFEEETEWYIMTVADGAGAAKFSRKGSQIACETVKAVCIEKLLANKDNFLKYNKSEDNNEIIKILQNIIGSAVYEAYNAIENEATERQCLVKDFATTLLLSLCKKFEYGWFVAAWWIGDGGIGIFRKEPEYLKLLGEPDSGEFAGQTRFLTMPDIIKNELYKRMQFDIVEDFTAIILMTDGVTDPKFETDANLNQIGRWHELWYDLNGSNEDDLKVDFIDNIEQSAEQLLKWLDFWSKGNHDDRTVAILF